jgi:hypothetical protein
VNARGESADTTESVLSIIGLARTVNRATARELLDDSPQFRDFLHSLQRLVAGRAPRKLTLPGMRKHPISRTRDIMTLHHNRGFNI